jgi:hypothetical protein
MKPVLTALQAIAALQREAREDQAQATAGWLTELVASQSLRASTLASPAVPDGRTTRSATSQVTANLNRGLGAPPNPEAKARPKPAFARDREIRIDARDRVAVAPTRSVPARAVTTLAATVLLALALCLGWVGGLNSDFFALRADLPSVERVTSSTAAIAAKPVQELPSNVRASTGNYETSQRSAPTADSSLRKQVARVPSPPAVDRTNLSTRSAPVPETKPTTIKGWTVREVEGGTAVLEGPNGIWRATLGDTVPGVGKIDSIVRWGNRWIIATSKGLISTR